jgi:hypothetical protein
MATTAEINALVDMALAAQQARATDAFNDALALNQAAQQAKTTAIDAL